jgi:hypothetical protein
MSLSEISNITAKVKDPKDATKEIAQVWCGIPVSIFQEIAARLAAAEQMIVTLTERITALEKLNAALAEKVG